MRLSPFALFMPSLRQWSLGRKIVVGNILFLILPLLLLSGLTLHHIVDRLHAGTRTGMEAAGTAIVDMIEASIDASIHAYLSAVAQKNLHIAEKYHQQYLEGEISEHQARRMVIDLFRAEQIGPSGYIYCLDSQGVIQLHPMTELTGKNVFEHEEYKYAQPLISLLVATKNGYLEYAWQHPSKGTEQPKAVQMVHFKPWDWIIAVACYRKEFADMVDFQAIEKRITDFRYGGSGYAFLLSDQGELLAHPHRDRPTNEIEWTARMQTDNIVLAADNTLLLPSQWQEPTQPGHEENVLLVRSIPQFGLVVGLTVPKSAIEPGLFSARTMIMLMLLTGASLSIYAALFLSRLIAAPLHRFAQRLEVPDTNAHTAYEGGCETTFLVSRFDQYVRELQTTNARLDTEVQFRKSAERFLRIYKTIFDNATEGILITDNTAKILAVNTAFTSITGYEASEALGENTNLLKSNHHDAAFYHQMWHNLTRTGRWEGEIWNKKKDGTVYPQWLAINSIRNERKEILYYFATFFEIGELKKREKQIAFMAYHDLLTRLPNRTFLENKLGKALIKARTEGEKVVIFFIDLDNFKNINDVFGHHLGDDLLIQVSQKLSALLGENGTLCRLGSDEFILLLEKVDHDALIYITANRILGLLKKPFLLDFKKIYINASIGVSIYPGDGETSMQLIRSADMAMHRAKREGKNRYVLFTQEMHAELYHKLRTENGIRFGLQHREFIVYYQPKVNIATGKTSSLEALIRWQKGNKIISPAVFIPIAEESSLIDDLCLFVMEESCAFHAIMRAQRVAVPISVNISPRQFLNADFIDIVEDLLKRYQVDPSFIEFEITETTAMKDVEHTLNIMHKLRSMGILFSIDDFGTGYSSLGYLNKMPVSTLKIDKQFIDDLESNNGIVATIIAISHQMHLNVVAEGVETLSQLNNLAALGCQEAQGYYFSRPVPADSILAYLVTERDAC
ncbi:bifunctional diguanylate cyclase/phosphodiesterase [Desulfobulbus alkaliphilus]|uniref:bifunctional diguanylate cyclase/phosphodiesterase n=1 Tax=Desulfobulbus alkaliphilus TaxID=869814 RepID=UPI0019633C81|nr:EAL domain-containing protein [Desulfobulbus alkaliphilus]MBM9538177.1 EAL domain-containing protein [Desulfobulbus alkaliphilus]